MAKKSRSSKSFKSKANPFTPMRRFFFKLELLKQSSSSDKSDDKISCRHQSSVVSEPPAYGMVSVNESASSATHSSNSTQTHHSALSQTLSQRACLAIQQHDQPFDTIVISTLLSYPFCCHEDLLTMSRAQLIDVAQLLNSRIPLANRLDITGDVSDADIRAWIEVLVGIKLAVPGAPKAARSRPPVTNGEEDKASFDFDTHVDAMPSPPTSPLSMRISRRQEKSLPLLTSPPRPLECLDEADEDIFASKRPLKRRKTQDAVVPPDNDVSMSETPPPPPSSSSRTPQTLSGDGGSTTPRRVLRSHSMKLTKAANSCDSDTDVITIDTSFVNTKPRYRSVSRSARNITGKDHISIRRSITEPAPINLVQYRPQDSSFLSVESRSRASSSSALSVSSVESSDSSGLVLGSKNRSLGGVEDDRQKSIVAGMVNL